ncbi:MAG: transglutaminase family protein [Chthoniobacterales bacterium]
MLFDILHTTDYRYSVPAIEAYLETRLTPPNSHAQVVRDHKIVIHPELPTSEYVDSFGNETNFFSHTLRHDRLLIEHRATVETFAIALPTDALEVPVAEVRQVVASGTIDYFAYLQPSGSVPLGGEASKWVRNYFAPGAPIGEALGTLNTAVYENFAYRPGTTTNTTPLLEIWRHRRGVCQDFAHIMLSVLRTAGIPARYVCGYIETDPPKPRPGQKRASRLVGSVATHAWVEVLVPGMVWVALDPTNKQWCGQRHVAVSFGRESADAAPVRGTFKGSGTQEMRVRVKMKRIQSRS